MILLYRCLRCGKSITNFESFEVRKDWKFDKEKGETVWADAEYKTIVCKECAKIV